MSVPGAHPVRTALRAVGAGARTVVAGLFGAFAYLARRSRRGPVPHVGFLGIAEALALAALAGGLVAASMILIDPMIPGLRPRMPLWLVTLADRLTDLGYSGVVLWPVGLAMAYLLLLSPRLDAMGRRVAAAVFARLGFVFLATGAIGLGVSVVKHLLGRARPNAAAHLPGPSPELTFDFLVWKSSFASFPSGHATTAFAAAVALGALWPRTRGALLALAAVVAATRIILGSHYPSDVIAGAAIGSAFALLMVKVFAARRIVFAVDGDRHIVPMAGPSARRLGALLPAAPLRPVESPEEARS